MRRNGLHEPLRWEGREEGGTWKDVSLGRRRRSREGDRRRGLWRRMKVIDKPVWEMDEGTTSQE